MICLAMETLFQSIRTKMAEKKAVLLAALVSLFGASTASAATLQVTVPTAYADGIDFTNVITTLGVIGGGVIGVYLAVKLIRWVLMTFM